MTATPIPLPAARVNLAEQVYATLKAQIHDFQFADLIRPPVEAVRSLYERAGLSWSAGAQAAMEAYLANKPQGKHGAHRYAVGEREQIERDRRHYARYQRFHGVPNEV